MTAEIIKFRLKSSAIRPGPQIRAGRDYLVIREDGCLGFVSKSTVLSNRIGNGPPEAVDDLQAGVRLAREAAERED